MIRSSTTIKGVLPLAVWWILASTVVALDKPNVLFIAIDDQNDWVGCLGGHPQVKTPHIDRLAKRGTLFANAHCQSPLCNSSRTSLMTGRRPSTTGIYGLAPWFRDVPALGDAVSLPQAFRQAGYHTYSTGKVYHSHYGRTAGDEFDVIGPPATVGTTPEKPLVQTPSKHPLVDWGLFPHRDQDKGDWKVATWAVDRLDKMPEAPFFLAVGFFLPHVPCYATEKWFALYPEDSVKLPAIQRHDRRDTPRFSWYLHWELPEPRLKFLEESGQWKNLVRSYLACTSFVDGQVGRLLAALEQNGLADNTIVVLWSDHGWHLGEKLITGKNSLWDRSTRVPLIFAGPGIARQSTCTQPVELLDIYPTLSELCGLSDNGQLEGVSLLPQLRDAQAERSRPAITTHGPGNHGIRDERWRYIVYADRSEELYDLKADPNEWTNVAHADQHRDRIAAMRRWVPTTNVPPVPGSTGRVLTFDRGQANWEGHDIEPDAAIPGL